MEEDSDFMSEVISKLFVKQPWLNWDRFSNDCNRIFWDKEQRAAEYLIFLQPGEPDFGGDDCQQMWGGGGNYSNSQSK